MFLPVLLIRDFGAWSWVVFAVPNVVGAGAMGFTLRNREQAASLREAHIVAARIFSLVTAAFQCFFFGWLAIQQGTGTAGLAGMACAAVMLLSSRRVRLSVFAVILWGISTYFFAELYFDPARPLLWPPSGGIKPWEALGLAASCTFGFLACPYLDLTFLHVRADASPRASRWAFPIGFGFFFLVMITFTYFYAWRFGFDGFGASASPMTLRGLSADKLIAAHICLQLAFTVVAHCWALRRADRGSSRQVRAMVLLLGISLLAGAARYTEGPNHLAGLSGGEVIYRMFMSFYGLIFPAYVWLCMVPTWKRAVPPTKRQLVVTLVAIGVAAPFMWIAFIERHMEAAIGGVAIVLLARLFIGPVRSTGPGPHGPSAVPDPTAPTPPPLAASVQE